MRACLFVFVGQQKFSLDANGDFNNTCGINRTHSSTDAGLIGRNCRDCAGSVCDGKSGSNLRSHNLVQVCRHMMDMVGTCAKKCIHAHIYTNTLYKGSSCDERFACEAWDWDGSLHRPTRELKFQPMSLANVRTGVQVANVTRVFSPATAIGIERSTQNASLVRSGLSRANEIIDSSDNLQAMESATTLQSVHHQIFLDFGFSATGLTTSERRAVSHPALRH